jgi:hypothetical protein
MSKAKAASLTSGFIATKGAAAPSAETPVKVLKEDMRKPIAVTVRLTNADYRRLKLHGLEHRQSNQEIIVAALNAYLSNDIK